MHIGGIVFQFTTKEPIVEYESPIDNNDVPYQSALSATEAYFLCEQRRMPRSRIKPPLIDAESSSLKVLPTDAQRWVLMYENLYELEDDEAKRVTKPLENYEELIVLDA